MKEVIRYRLAYCISDYLTTLSGILLFSRLRYEIVADIHETYGSWLAYLKAYGVELTLAFLPPFMLLVYYLTGYYVNVTNKSRVQELLRTLMGVAIGTLSYMLVALLNDYLPMRSQQYELMVLFALCMFALTWTNRLIITTIIKKRIARDKRPKRFMAILPDPGELGHARELAKAYGLTVADTAVTAGGRADIEAISGSVISGKLDGVLVMAGSLDTEGIQRLMYDLYLPNLPILVAPDDSIFSFGAVMKYDHVIGEPLLDITRPRLPDAFVATKRAIDVAAAACGLLLAAPLIGVLALVIRRQSPGPVIYSQERIGYRRKPFRIHKLRSMRLDAEADNTPRLSSDDDARILPIGRLMRHYRLDELPNLWNVLVGEMSLVGPRPERQYFISQIMKEAPYYALLHRVRPGVTSWGMVRYGYASTVDDMIKRLKYDILYVQNLSLEVDLKILLYTFRTLLRGEGK